MTTNFDPDVIRARIKACLESAKWSDYKLADASGVPAPTISRFMSGRHKTIEVYTLVRIAQAFGKRSAQLTGEEPLEDDILDALSDPKIQLAIKAMMHMDEPTRAQYVRIGSTLVEPEEGQGAS